MLDWIMLATHGCSKECVRTRLGGRVQLQVSVWLPDKGFVSALSAPDLVHNTRVLLSKTHN
jgi:hypothetical protein